MGKKNLTKKETQRRIHLFEKILLLRKPIWYKIWAFRLFRFQDLRATFITHMFANGASIAEVQSVVGHSDLKTTQVYLRLAGVCVKGATDKLSFSLPSYDKGEKVVSLKDRVELIGTQLAVNG